jgi:hypothetical protein
VPGLFQCAVCAKGGRFGLILRVSFFYASNCRLWSHIAE